MTEFLIAAAVCYVAVVGGLYGCQRQLLYLPDRSRPALSDHGMRGFSEVTLATADGLQLLAWYLPAENLAPVVLYLHGNGGHIGYRAERAKAIAAAGFGVLLLEYRGYGGNPGSPHEEGFHIDASAALAFLDAAGISRSRVVIVGESLGTAVAVRLAAESAVPVGALVLEAPFPSIAEVAQHHYPYVPARWLVRDRFDAASRIARVRAPLLVLHGGRDTVIPPRFGRALFEAAPEPKQFVFIDDADHAGALVAGFEAFQDFVRRHVRPSTGDMRRYREAS